MPAREPATHVIARIGRPHGLRGEVTVQVHTDAPQDRLVPGAELVTDPPERGPLLLRSVRVHQGVFLLGFAGVPDRGTAETLRGTRLVAPGLMTGTDEDEAWYEQDLLGFAVALSDGTRVGQVSGLHTRPVQDLIEVTLDAGGQALVPLVQEIVPEVDEVSRTVVIDPPPGLLGLAAPGE